MGGVKERKRNQEQRARVCLEEQVDVGKFSIVLINSARACSCSDHPGIFGDGSRLRLYMWAALRLREKTEKSFALQTESILEISSTTIRSSTVNIRLDVRV